MNIIIYNNIDSWIINDGHMLEVFIVTRGGSDWVANCPHVFFVIAVYLLAVAIRHNVQIKSVTQNGVEKKINQFAGETVNNNS